jgi:aspartate/methionine/tyrosine aminotransferase
MLLFCHLLQRLIQPGTKLVVVNFPHNPTGAMLSPGDYQALIARCREVGAWLFSDEMYKFTGDNVHVKMLLTMWRCFRLGGGNSACIATGATQ